MIFWTKNVDLNKIVFPGLTGSKNVFLQRLSGPTNVKVLNIYFKGYE